MEAQIRETIAKKISAFHLPRYEDIPNVGLYLEQTVSYITDYLRPLQEGAITSSMASNYVKKKLVANPVRKHDSAAAYHYFCEELESAVRQVFGLSAPEHQSWSSSSTEPVSVSENVSSEERSILKNTITAVVHKIYLEQWISRYAEKKAAAEESL